MFSHIAILLSVVHAHAIYPFHPISFFVWGGTKCDFCHIFMNTGLNRTLEHTPIHKYINYEFFPFGNSYYILPNSGWNSTYDSSHRREWALKCYEKFPPGDECLGELVTQFGPTEVFGLSAELCAKYHYLDAWLARARFSHCFQVLHNATRNDVIACANMAGFDARRILACTDSNEWRAHARTDAARTLLLAPFHIGLPYTIIDACGTIAPVNPQTHICNAYRGPVTRSACPMRPDAIPDDEGTVAMMHHIGRRSRAEENPWGGSC